MSNDDSPNQVTGRGEPSPNDVVRSANGGALDRLRAIVRTALVADALDAVGLTAQCVRSDVGPVCVGTVMVGRALTARCVPVSAPPERPYVGLLAALDAVGAGDVMVLAADGSDRAALWGELVSHACAARGAAGAVTDGVIRDVRAIRALGFPVFARGSVPYDVNGRFEVERADGPVQLGGVEVSPGDLVVGDDDGVVVVPRAVEAEVVARVLEKATGEERFREAVQAGMRPSEAYDRYGVL